ncbi:MAG: hypothetical protein V7785_20910 [Bermanella sp.]
MSAPNYVWTCNACGTSVKAGVGSCSKCGCVAGASGDETEKLRDPSGYFHKLKHKKFEASILSIIYGPAFIFSFASSGRFLELLVVVITLVVLIVMEWKKIQSVFQDKSYLLYCTGLGGFLSLVMLINIFFVPELFFSYFWIGLPVILIATYYLLIGKKGKEACERFNE